MLLSVAFWPDEFSMFFSVVVALGLAFCAMPTTWFSIEGCPFQAECCANTSAGTKKQIRWSARTRKELLEKVAGHLTRSPLHMKSRQVAFDAITKKKICEHDEPSDDENDISGYEEAIASASGGPEGLAMEPAMASSTRARMENEEHEDTEPRMERWIQKIDPDNYWLIDEISTRVVVKLQALNNQNKETHAEKCILDAECAARKAQYISQKAASAFGEGAEILKRARVMLKDS